MDTIAAQEAWMKSAACISMSSDMFYNHDQDRSKTTRAAKQICSKCPVILECRVYASEHNEQFGIWGGMNSVERKSWWKKAKANLYKTL